MKLENLTPNAYYNMVEGKPQSLEQEEEGKFIYRYGVQPQMVSDGGEEQQVGWQCREVHISEPTKAAVKKAIIRSVIDVSEELALINDYNKHILKIKEDADAVGRYKAFLQFMVDLDEMLSADFKE